VVPPLPAGDGVGQLHLLPVWGDGEAPLGDRGSPGVFPLLVGGGDFIPEPARSELVDRPAPGVGLVVKARPGPRAGIAEFHEGDGGVDQASGGGAIGSDSQRQQPGL